MEKICQRCQGELNPESNFCPACGLPQILYSNDETPGPISQQPWHIGGIDAGEVAWHPAMRIAFIVAVPAGIACAMATNYGPLKLIWMLLVASFVVALYVRRVQPPWITAGAGARIGLVSGIFTAGITFLATGIAFFSRRFFFGDGASMDANWSSYVDKFQKVYFNLVQQSTPDLATLASARNIVEWMRKPEGHAGMELASLTILCVMLLLISMLGGILGARLSARSRHSRN